MKATLILFISGFLIIATTVCNAQAMSIPNDTLVWQINGLQDVSSDTTMSYYCQIITYGNHAISWVQKDQGYANSFPIRSADGQWTDPNQDGSLDYKVYGFSQAGHVIFTRTAGAVQIAFDFEKKGKNIAPYVFAVTSVSKQR